MRKAATAGDHLSVERVDEHEWRFQYPRLDAGVYEEFHETLELLDAGEYRVVLPRLRKLIKRFPEFIDARHHLAVVLTESDPTFEGIARVEWRSAVEMGNAALPPEFVLGRDRLEWAWLDNRPFLRACAGLALSAVGEGQTGEALAIWQDMLDLNPNDNQGIRSLAVNGLIARRRPIDALALCDRYPDDGMPDLLYGRVLALLMLDRKAEAVAALEIATDFAPLVAKELLKKTHHAPRNLNPDYITVGGADEAYHYWHDAGKFWKRTPGALAFVREMLDRRKLTND